MNNIATIIKYISDDFETLWDLIAHNQEHIPRGNYLFAVQSMIFLEVVSRVCNKIDKLHELSLAIEDRYFQKLPSCLRYSSKEKNDFLLPYRDESSKHQYLIYWLFKAVRHGTAHYYDQIILQGVDFYLDIGVTGPKISHCLSYIHENRPKVKHLQFQEIEDEQSFSTLGLKTEHKLIRLYFNPGLFYLDIKAAIKSIRLVDNYGKQPMDEFVSELYKKDMQINCKLKTLEKCVKIEK